MKTSVLSTPAIPVLSPLVAAPKKRPSDWICGFGGASLSYTPDQLAQTIVQDWLPNQSVKVAPSTPGWSGMAAYKVSHGSQNYHLKVMIPALVDGQRAPVGSAKQIEGIHREARRAKWAADQSIAPPVFAIDEARGAYACNFVDGIIPTPEQGKGKLLLPYLKTLQQLQAASTVDMPLLSRGRNWLYDINSQDCLAEAQRPHAPDVQQQLLQLERALESYLSKTSFPKVPVHGDLKLDNTLATPQKVYFVDWGNLHLDDAMTDVGCYLAMVDMPTRKMLHVLSLYDAQSDVSAQSLVAEDSSRLFRLQANTALLRLKNCTFYGQWTGTQEKADYLFNVLAANLPELRQGALREIGF